MLYHTASASEAFSNVSASFKYSQSSHRFEPTITYVRYVIPSFMVKVSWLFSKRANLDHVKAPAGQRFPPTLVRVSKALAFSSGLKAGTLLACKTIWNQHHRPRKNTLVGRTSDNPAVWDCFVTLCIHALLRHFALFDGALRLVTGLSYFAIHDHGSWS